MPDNDIQATLEIGQRVRATRLSVGITQEKLGESVGVSFQMIQKYERGACRIPSARLIAIARTLNTSPSYLLEGEARINGAERIPLTSEEIQHQAKHLQKLMEKQHPSSPNLLAARHALNTWLMLIKTP